jgi:hypothetical protein
VLEGARRGLRLRVDPEAHGAQLHVGDWMMAVPALGRCREPDDVASFHFAEDTLELDGCEMMTLVDDDLSVPCDQIGD